MSPNWDSFTESEFHAFEESPLHARIGGQIPIDITMFGGRAHQPDTPYEELVNAQSYDYGTDAWEELTDMPVPGRYGHAGVTLASKHYALAGFAILARLADNDELYKDTWASKADVPVPARRATCACHINHRGYLLGGEGGGVAGWWLSDNDEYDPDAWVAKADLPVPPRNSSAASTARGKLYMTGGEWNNLAPGVSMIDNDEYVVDVWTARADIPFGPIRWHATTTMDNKVYLFVGIGVLFGSHRYTEEYDPATDAWLRKTDYPELSRSWGLASADSTGCYYWSGQHFTGYLVNQVDHYDANDVWESREPYTDRLRDRAASSTP